VPRTARDGLGVEEEDRAREDVDRGREVEADAGSDGAEGVLAGLDVGEGHDLLQPRQVKDDVRTRLGRHEPALQ